MDEAGKTIGGRYELERKLGEGAFGATWLAVDYQMRERRVALKLMRGGAAAKSAEFFRQEAAALARIDNPHIGRIFDFGAAEDSRPYLVLEHIEGRSLEVALSNEPLRLPDALAVAQAVADGLAAAHRIGVIHRDLKPANIIIPSGDQWAQAKLLDFGVRGELKVETGLTTPGEVYGTPQYMSPEQMTGQAQSPATDVYGLGAVLFEMIYGRPPFTGEAFTEIAFKTLQEPVTFPPVPSLPDDVRALLARCLNKKPDERFADGNTLLIALRQLSAVSSIAPASASSPAPIAPAQSFPAPPPSPYVSWSEAAPTAAPPSKGSPTRLMLMLAFGAVVVAGLIFLFWTLGIGSSSGTRASTNTGPYVGILLGLGLAGLSVALWFGLRRWLAARKAEIQRDADNILLGRDSSVEVLTQSLAIKVDEIIVRLRRLDDLAIGQTLAIMVKEYESAKESKDRQSALMNAVSLLEKLTQRLSPWYVRHDKLVAFVVSSVGVLSGLATIVMNAVKIKNGNP